MIELTTSVLMLASAFSPISGKTAPVVTTESDMNVTATVNQDISPDHPLSTLSLEAYVRDYFRNTPILAEIARCESQFRQFGKNGDVIRGKVNSGDIGVMQINKYYHEEDAVKQGFDIYSVDGNLGFAKALYQKYGVDPWGSSSKCWKGYHEIARN